MAALPRHLHAHRAAVRLCGKAERLKLPAAVRRVRHPVRRRPGIARRGLPRLLARDASARQSPGRARGPAVGERAVVDQRWVIHAAFARDRRLRPIARRVGVQVDLSHRLGVQLLAHAAQVRIEPLAGDEQLFNLRLVARGQHAAAGDLRRQRHHIVAHLPGKLHRAGSRLVAQRQARQPVFHVLRQQRCLAEQVHALARARGDQQLLQVHLDVRHRADYVRHVPLPLHGQPRLQRPVVGALRGIYAQRHAQQHREHDRQRCAVAKALPFLFHAAPPVTPRSCARRCSGAPRASRSTCSSPSRGCNSTGSRPSDPSR